MSRKRGVLIIGSGYAHRWLRSLWFQIVALLFFVLALVIGPRVGDRTRSGHPYGPVGIVVYYIGDSILTVIAARSVYRRIRRKRTKSSVSIEGKTGLRSRP